MGSHDWLVRVPDRSIQLLDGGDEDVRHVHDPDNLLLVIKRMSLLQERSGRADLNHALQSALRVMSYEHQSPTSSMSNLLGVLHLQELRRCELDINNTVFSLNCPNRTHNSGYNDGTILYTVLYL